MRVGRRAVAAGVGAVALAAGTAWAAAPTIVATDNVYSAAQYVQSQGEIPTLRNDGANPHNVTAVLRGPDRRPLFRSPTITGGSIKVKGAQYLTSGDYDFFCTVHPTTMRAKLRVNNAGTPVPRPDIEVRILSRRIKRVVKSRRLVVRLTAITPSQSITLIASKGKRRLGAKKGLNLAGGVSRKVRIKLSRKGIRALRRRSSARVQVKGRVPFGAPDTARRRLQ